MASNDVQEVLEMMPEVKGISAAMQQVLRQVQEARRGNFTYWDHDQVGQLQETLRHFADRLLAESNNIQESYPIHKMGEAHIKIVQPED